VNNFNGVKVDAAYGPGSSAASVDGATSGSGEGGGYSIGLTIAGNTVGMDGLTFGGGFGATEAGTGK
jgi:hypothetical protein